MQNFLNPLVTMYQTQLEASRRFADALFSGTEKIDRVVIGASHRAFNEQLNFVQAMTAARDPRSVGTTLQSGFLSRNPDEAMNYQKEIMRIFAEMQNEIGRSMQDYLEQVGSHATSTATAPLETAQDQANDAAFNPMTSMFSVWESAFKEVADLAKKNMMAARSTAENAARRTMQSAGNYANVANVAAGSAQDAATSAVDSAASISAQAARQTATVAEEGSDEKRGVPPGGGKRK
ncbi:phasin family protein [Noviherbaspirillum sp.]|uniref:phasin family protein n=1 Tax=Noviherbaspirillum sp. TaxID=1926288 RepID=UPI002B48E670|nr:phasin family protein [Noviherbaspirillum sp.]HJV80189.1 phasin family protein [Noviherbaspirillum sp.]